MVHGDRQADYGHPKVNFRRIGIIWQAILDLPEPIPPWQVALMLNGMKLARLIQTPDHKDTQDDADGYIETLRMVLED